MHIGIFDVVGVTHYEDNILQLAEENEDYNLTPSQLKKEYTYEDVIYKGYYPPNSRIKLEPEPTNQYDPNAIKVCCDGLTLGYIKKEQTAKVKELLEAGYPYTVNIDGGECKRLDLDEDENIIIEEDTEPFEVTVFFSDFPEPEAPKQSKGFKTFLLIIGIVLIIMSLLLMLAVPVVGIIGIIIGVLVIVYSRKK